MKSWLLGFAIVWRVGRLHISASYVVAFVVFAFVRSALTGVPWQVPDWADRAPLHAVAASVSVGPISIHEDIRSNSRPCWSL